MIDADPVDYAIPLLPGDGIGPEVAADRLEHAHEATLRPGVPTPEVGGRATTSAFVDAVIERL